MSTSRAESQNPSRYGRKRSETLQSMLRSPPSATPLVVGNTKDLTLWVNESPSSAVPNTPDVILNTDCWPGAIDGDMVRVTEVTDEEEVLGDGAEKDTRWEKDGFLFIVKRDDAQGCAPGLQISVSKSIASAFGLRHYMDVRLTKVDRSRMCADYIEVVFQDQYLGRSDMWRLGKQLQGRCVHVGQDIMFVGTPTGKISNVFVEGRNVSAGLVTAKTKAVFRSLSAKVTIFIQVCQELWEFAGDGERYNEKVVHSFLPALFRKWREAGTNHIVTIVLISRVFYEPSEIEYAAGPLRKDEDDAENVFEGTKGSAGRWYKDFFKVITDLEVVQDWKPTLVSLKDAFVAFQRDILLTHHYHRATLSPSFHSSATASGGGAGTMDDVRLVGRISFAHEGPILEALNLALNPLSVHYIDRSLSITGVGAIIVTPGTGYYRVSKRLLRLTTTRLLDQGFGLDIVSLAKPPLHQTPVFSFRGSEPNPEMDNTRAGWRSNDPLWGGDGSTDDDITKRKMVTFWWEPFWATISFWDQQMDLPFRQDRFVARAKMRQIEMLGLLEHDVLSSINVPYLPENFDPMKTPADEQTIDFQETWKGEADQFDLERFALRKHPPPIHLGGGRDSGTSSGVTTVMDSSSYRSHHHDKRSSYILQRTSTATHRIPPIEESPRRIYADLPPEGIEKGFGPSTVGQSSTLSSSPRSSILSTKEEDEIKPEDPRASEQSGNRSTLTSKFSSSWLFNPFRSGASSSKRLQQQPAPVSLSPKQTTPSAAVRIRTPPSSRAPTITESVSAMSISQGRSPRLPMNIRSTPSRNSALRQRLDDETPMPSRSLTKHSPINTGVSPRDDSAFVHRRSTITSLSNVTQVASSPIVRTNPLRPNIAVSYTQASLASRWQHMFPQPLYKHEIKWQSMVTPGSLPLTTEYFPSTMELETSYEMFSYDFVVDPSEMRSFLVKPPTLSGRENADQVRQAWALVAMRGMAALRLVQGFQFVIRPASKKSNSGGDGDKGDGPTAKYFSIDDDRTPKPIGASEIFQTDTEPVFLSMTNEIHRISYNGESIQVKRYVRRTPPTQPFQYECLVWPKLGVGYTELSTTFGTHGLENYGWNRLDMLIAGYERNFSESLRYWRTRFIVIPTLESPQPALGPSGEKLNDEETRLSGSDKLAQIFSSLVWTPAGERDRASTYPPVRFLPTYLSPTASVLDEHLVSQLEEVQAAGPLGKKIKSERTLSEYQLTALAKLMREDGELAIKDHRWRSKFYPDSFTGYDFVNWLVREFRDVSTREQAAECGQSLLEAGLFEHCRHRHGFIDGVYFYCLKGEYAVVRTPRTNFLWPRSSRNTNEDTKVVGYYPGGAVKHGAVSSRNRKHLVLSNTIVADTDTSKKSDQAEIVVLHYDLIHNPANVFHFELNWLGTSARCIEDVLRQCGTKIERFGLKLVEAYVTQISDIRERNPFQSCFPVRLAVPPPIVPDLAKRVALLENLTANTNTINSSATASSASLSCATHVSGSARYYFEYALLSRFGFILDIEANQLYPDRVDVVYNYRRSEFAHSQFVHRTGVAFVQVLGGAEGFLFLTNRLMAPGRMTMGSRNGGSVDEERRADGVGGFATVGAAAEPLRVALADFCSNAEELNNFYDEQLELLPQCLKEVEEPPPLSI